MDVEEYEPIWFQRIEGDMWSRLMIDFDEKSILLERLEELKPPLHPGYFQIPPACGFGNNLYVHAVRFASGEIWDARNGWRKVEK